MSSINPEIDAAIPQMKKRAAKFNETKTMGGVAQRWLVSRAKRNIQRAELRVYEGDLAVYLREDLLDTMNLCALALSLLSARSEENTP